MKLHYLFYFVPFLVLAILIEALFYYKKYKTYPIKPTMANFGVSVGVAASFIFRDILITILFFLAYNHRFFTFPISLSSDVVGNLHYIFVLFISVEFCFYWQHRISHKVRWMWASHSVHHSSSQLNLTSGSRLPWTTLITGDWIFYFPVVFLGFTPIQTGMMLTFHLFCQFLAHTEVVPKLGFLEKFVMTPSNHRVHHDIDHVSRKSNYGSMLVVFDKLFGTYTPESDNPQHVYGLDKPLTSNNPFVITMTEWVNLYKDLRKSKSIKEAFMYCFGKPGWKPKKNEIKELT